MEISHTTGHIATKSFKIMREDGKEGCVRGNQSTTGDNETKIFKILRENIREG